MAFTVDLTYLSAASSVSASLQKVRQMIGDTDTTWQLLDDAIIVWSVASGPFLTAAAAVCCDVIAAGYARQVNTTNAALRVAAAERMKHYMTMADRLRSGDPGDVPGQAGVIAATGYGGGNSVSDKSSLASDADNVAPVFGLGQDDNPTVVTTFTTGF